MRRVVACARCRQETPDGGRGLCSTCHSWARREGVLADYPRRYRTASEWVEDYEWLLPQYGDAFPAIAARLGVTVGALEMALRRAGYKCKDPASGTATGGRKVMVRRAA